MISPTAKNDTGPETPIASMKQRIPSLDGLRAISILLVLIGHSESTYSHHNRWINYLLVIFGNSSLGVLIFFVISGFLITTLLLSEYKNTGKILLLDFYLRRAFRIFPAFYCYLSFIFCLWMLNVIQLNGPDFITAAFFLRDYSALFVHHYPAGDWFVGHTWTLSVEEQFYWLWPIGLIFLKPRRSIILAAALIVLAPIIRTSEYFVLPETREQIPIMLHTRVDSLMTGCLAALLYANNKVQNMLDIMYQRKIPLVATVFIFIFSPILSAHLRGTYALPIGFTLENAGAVILLLWAISHAQTKVGKILNSPLMVHLGVISYSLYLWQQVFLTRANPLLLDKFPINIVLAIAAAEISYFALERPILSWHKRFRASHSISGLSSA